MDMGRIRILVATDDEIFQEGLCRFLEDEEDLECVARAANGEDAIRLAKELMPDVAIIDVGMPLLNPTAEVTHAAEVASQIKAAHPAIVMLMVSAYGFQPTMLASLEAGASGYLLKKTSAQELISAVRSLYSGKAVFDLEDISKLIGHLGANKGVTIGGIAPLRSREVEVLRVAAKGASNKAIASELGISERTVQTHMVNIFRKLEVSSRTEAVLRALREGWLTLDDLT
jgi:NarL family two-component system response regulator LiaR